MMNKDGVNIDTSSDEEEAVAGNSSCVKELFSTIDNFLLHLEHDGDHSQISNIASAASQPSTKILQQEPFSKSRLKNDDYHVSLLDDSQNTTITNTISISNNQIIPLTSSDQKTKSTSSSFKRSRTPNVRSFPDTLQLLLEQSHERGYEHIVSWQSHGRAFRVNDKAQFLALVMPRYFQQTRFTSFQRQLALYGFRRLTKKGNDFGAYYHEFFLRGSPELCSRIERIPIKGIGSQKIQSIDTEPDFHNMPPSYKSKDISFVELSRSEAKIKPDSQRNLNTMSLKSKGEFMKSSYRKSQSSIALDTSSLDFQSHIERSFSDNQLHTINSQDRIESGAIRKLYQMKTGQNNNEPKIVWKNNQNNPNSNSDEFGETSPDSLSNKGENEEEIISMVKFLSDVDLESNS